MRPMSTYVAAIWLALQAGPVDAACFAAYQAKQDAPLRLHYGVIELPVEPCEVSAEAEARVAERIGVDGWTLLQVVRVMGADDVEKERDNAGAYFLRY